MDRNRMPRRKGRDKWIALAVASGLAALLGCGGSTGDAVDPRPVGTLEDVASLSSRDDLNVIFILIDTPARGPTQRLRL